MISHQEALCIHATKERAARRCLQTWNFIGWNPNELLAFPLNLMDTFDHCGVCKGKVLHIKAFLKVLMLRKCTRRKHANGMSVNAQNYNGPWLVVINALLERFLIRKEL